MKFIKYCLLDSHDLSSYFYNKDQLYT